MSAAEFIARARAVTDPATPGPWTVTPWHDKGVMPAGWADDTLAIEERGPFMHVAASDAADAAFIAASRTMLPAAVAAIEAVLAREDVLNAEVGHQVYEATDLEPEECTDDCPACAIENMFAAITAALDPS